MDTYNIECLNSMYNTLQINKSNKMRNNVHYNNLLKQKYENKKLLQRTGRKFT